MAYSCFKLFKVSLFPILIFLINIRGTLTQGTSTESTSETGTTTLSVSTTSTSKDILISATEIRSTINPLEEPLLIMRNASTNISLVPFTLNLTNDNKYRIELTISPFESTLEFRLAFEREINFTNSSSKFSQNLSFKDATRFMIALENDHFNLDVVSLPFSKDSTGKISFGNTIEDFSWNKKNGIMLRDSVQNYKWISSGAKEDGSEFFVVFSRHWLTCDEQDIQFTLSTLKIWWLIDTNDNSSSPSYKTASHKMLEKQEATPAPAVSEEPSQATTEVPEPPQQSTSKSVQVSTQPPQQKTISTSIPIVNETTLNENVSPSISTESAPRTKPNSSLTSTTMSSLEVEILKSISDFNFQGPVNISLQAIILTNSSSSVYLKTCDDSPILFNCSKSTFTPEMIKTTRHFLYIWRLIITTSHSNNSSLDSVSLKNPPEFQTQPCIKILDLIKHHKPTFNAFSGINRTPKSYYTPSKNSANVNLPIQSTIATYVNILITHVLFISITYKLSSPSV